MKFLAVSLFALSLSSAGALAAASPCANYAKYGAIRAYKAEAGGVQGSDGIQHSARLLRSQDDVYQYLVTISDNNEDGETWEVAYKVTVRQLEQGAACKVLAVRKLGGR